MYLWVRKPHFRLEPVTYLEEKKSRRGKVQHIVWCPRSWWSPWHLAGGWCHSHLITADRTEVRWRIWPAGVEKRTQECGKGRVLTKRIEYQAALGGARTLLTLPGLPLSSCIPTASCTQSLLRGIRGTWKTMWKAHAMCGETTFVNIFAVIVVSKSIVQTYRVPCNHREVHPTST